ncbi:hypothetical protein HYT25_00235 [Candidatus Pacearchaeota archaeon]|nr:hypothetical protein [Candidatus Pacearchaeota archaeon]
MGERLRQVRYDENVAVVHQDGRRTIYDPDKIFDNLDGLFCQHNVIVLSQDGLELGNHYHDYKELFFTPTGEFDFKLIDIDDFAMKRFLLKRGDRLLIPEGIGHVVTGKSGNVLMGYGNVRFNPKRLIPCSRETLQSLASMDSKSF